MFLQGNNPKYLSVAYRKIQKPSGYDTMHRPKSKATKRKFTKYRSDTTRGPDISSNWRLQAELVARRLLAYTPTPSNPSFMGALVP